MRQRLACLNHLTEEAQKQFVKLQFEVVSACAKQARVNLFTQLLQIRQHSAIDFSKWNVYLVDKRLTEHWHCISMQPRLKTIGFQCIRFPVSWDRYQQNPVSTHILRYHRQEMENFDGKFCHYLLVVLVDHNLKKN